MLVHPDKPYAAASMATYIRHITEAATDDLYAARARGDLSAAALAVQKQQLYRLQDNIKCAALAEPPAQLRRYASYAVLVEVANRVGYRFRCALWSMLWLGGRLADLARVPRRAVFLTTKTGHVCFGVMKNRRESKLRFSLRLQWSVLGREQHPPMEMLKFWSSGRHDPDACPLAGVDCNSVNRALRNACSEREERITTYSFRDCNIRDILSAVDNDVYAATRYTGHLDARVVAACYSHTPFPDEDLDDGAVELSGSGVGNDL